MEVRLSFRQYLDLREASIDFSPIQLLQQSRRSVSEPY